MRVFVKLVTAVIVSLSLVGCWIPEQFDATVKINADGGYTYTYDGILTFALALADAKRGVLDARGEAEVAKLAPELRRDGFRKAEYLGKGRFSVAFDRTVSKGQPSFFLSKELQIFYIVPQNDGTIAIGAFRPDANALRQFNEIGAKIEGTLSVSIASGITVVRHNAESEPWLGGMIGSYKWKINSPSANPFMIVRTSTR